MSQQVTVTEHILLHQKMVPGATGQFTRLFNELVLSAKIITRAVNKAGLVDILGFTGDVNVQGEEVKKLDEYANRILIHRLARSGVLCAMASEENADIIEVPESLPRGDYIIIFDPLDGSSNIDVNVNIGTIFSIFKRISDPEAPLLSGDVLQKGCEQVAAGYILYGSSTMLVFTCGDGVHGFTLDPSVGEFLLSHPNIRIPEQGKIYSVNEGYERYWDRDTKKALAYFKSPKNALRKPYSGRYIGSLVADFHRNLLYGGIFMYPADLRDPKKPSGKLRLTCECNPMAFIVEQAGGLATDGLNRILDIEPEHLHQRVPFFCGSFNDVQMVQEIFQDEARRKKETVMRILGIETSCDETAVALVDDGRLLCEKLATQIDVHALFGGVVPEIASREHLRVLPRLYRELMDETGVSPEEIDGVAVARGPGLLGSLLVGVSFAKGLCLSTGANLIGVNHLWAHLLAPGLTGELVFPALGLLVSGGHTHTYLVKSPVEFELLGRTLDDAAGEAFDKVAKLLNFPYPGGRYIDALAQEGEADKQLFPRPYIENVSLDFSFSGLKTAVANYVSTHSELIFPEMADPEMVAALPGEERERLARVCASFNWSVADTLRIKVDRALKQVGPVRSLIVAGGVAANSLVRETMGELAADNGLVLTLPDLSLCTDNGSMIAYAGWLLAEAGRVHDLDLEAVPPRTGRTVGLDGTVKEMIFSLPLLDT